MCIAVHVPKGITSVTEKIVRRCFENNSDGGGFIIPEPHKVQVYKGFFTVDSFVQALMPHLETNAHGVVFHCRIMTHGARDKKNCHPHKVVKHNAAFVHNGIISMMQKDKEDKASDSILFGRWCFGNLPQDWYKNATIRALIEHAIGGSNKIVYVSECGDVTILNEDNGSWDEGVWYSNKSYNYTTYKGSYKGQCYQGWDSDFGSGGNAGYGESFCGHDKAGAQSTNEGDKAPVGSAGTQKLIAVKDYSFRCARVLHGNKANGQIPTCGVCWQELDEDEVHASLESGNEDYVCIQHIPPEISVKYWHFWNENRAMQVNRERGESAATSLAKQRIDELFNLIDTEKGDSAR